MSDKKRQSEQKTKLKPIWAQRVVYKIKTYGRAISVSLELHRK